jgi:hypothetical protein
MALEINAFAPGTRVRVTQQMPQTHRTGSWFAHGKDDKVWLDRLELRRDDGELVTLNLDQWSMIEPVG